MSTRRVTGQALAMMEAPQDKQARFNHAFSSPLTAMRGALDLLRHPHRMADDPVTRELLDTLERSCARLRAHIDILLANSQLRGDVVEITAPLAAILGAEPADNTPAAPRDEPELPAYTTSKPSAPERAAPAGDSSETHSSVLLIGECIRDEYAIDSALR